MHRLIKRAGIEDMDFKDKYAAIKIHFKGHEMAVCLVDAIGADWRTS
ncbi:hypothetical protein [Spirochaeta isovalerica]|uniref:Uncharacterized protein n=1 Tax=Spirochaeta isovalerica TaxID=150 RepID=A0A841RF55_9SPIO|nr:hypothetical protein [Spirochaeta isovalerica]MBB6481228.1 hypothetical protein [Spirochaeta isovalerica]